MAASVYSRALLKATDLVGGREQLAKLLHVPKADLDSWIADEAKLPRDIFLRIVDLILDETAPVADAGPQEPHPRDAAGGADRQR
jgi:hypothetical protein